MSVNEEQFEKLTNELRGILIDGTEVSFDDSGYSASADAMWRAAVAVFNHVASAVGATGFQASWAALRFYGEAMSIDGPFVIIKLADALYPQYDLPGGLQRFIDENHEWLTAQAREKLLGHDDDPLVHPNVLAHWRKLAEGRQP